MPSARLLLILLVLATDAPKPSVKVTPRAVFAGQAVRVTCRVPRYEPNRLVSYGVEGWSATERQLDGVDSRVTWEITLEHVPCDAGAAFCEVARADRTSARVTMPLTVVGCGEP